MKVEDDDVTVVTVALTGVEISVVDEYSERVVFFSIVVCCEMVGISMKMYSNFTNK
jgi:hypothetical protein